VCFFYQREMESYWEQLAAESSDPRNWVALFFIISNIVHTLLAVALLVCAVLLPGVFFDYTNTHPVEFSSVRVWRHAALVRERSRVLLLGIYFSLLGFAAVLLIHVIELLHYYAVHSQSYMVTHHALTIVLVSWIFLDGFVNAFSMLPLLMHCLVMINPYGRAITWLYTIYAQSYVCVVTAGLVLMLGPRRTPSDVRSRRDHAFLALLIAVHVLNLANMADEDTHYFGTSDLCAVALFQVLWSAAALRYTRQTPPASYK